MLNWHARNIPYVPWASECCQLKTQLSLQKPSSSTGPRAFLLLMDGLLWDSHPDLCILSIWPSSFSLKSSLRQNNVALQSCLSPLIQLNPYTVHWVWHPVLCSTAIKNPLMSCRVETMQSLVDWYMHDTAQVQINAFQHCSNEKKPRQECAETALRFIAHVLEKKRFARPYLF